MPYLPGRPGLALPGSAGSNLLLWAKGLCRDPDFLLARHKRLRYQLRQVAGRLVRTSWRSLLRLDARWPWAKEPELAFTRLRSLPIGP